MLDPDDDDVESCPAICSMRRSIGRSSAASAEASISEEGWGEGDGEASRRGAVCQGIHRRSTWTKTSLCARRDPNPPPRCLH